MFAKYHYLNHSHNNAAKVYIATINDSIAGFLSVLHFPHPKAKNIKKIHRLVILPDFQGAGFGLLFLNYISKLIVEQKQRCTIVTSSPSLVYGLKKDKNWRCTHIGRNALSVKSSSLLLNKTISINRITTAWEYKE